MNLNIYKRGDSIFCECKELNILVVGKNTQIALSDFVEVFSSNLKHYTKLPDNYIADKVKEIKDNYMKYVFVEE